MCDSPLNGRLCRGFPERSDCVMNSDGGPSLTDDSPTYMHPPIVEATVELRIANRIPDDDVDKLQRLLAPEYAKVEPVTELLIAFSLDGTQPPPPPPTGKKYKLTSEDGAWIVQLGASSVALSNLAPYVGWLDFEKQIRGIYKTWRRIVGKRQVERLGMRYINRVDIPGNVVKPEEWFTVYSQFPDELGLSANEAQSVIAGTLNQEIGVKIATALVPPALIDHLSLILDIDVFHTSVTVKGDDEVWAALGALHDQKNRVFESCITDRTRGLFR